VIVSHKYKFIFIKTHKVAGTSVEFALTPFAGEDGIVTPFAVKIDEKERQQSGIGGARNYETDNGAYRSHMPAQEVRTLLGPGQFDSYFKFSIERNSYDKAVSMYSWMNRDPKRPLNASFEEFAAGDGLRPAADFDRYCIDGKPAMDFMVLYHDLQKGLDEVAQRLGLPERVDVSAIRRKSGYRSTPEYRAHYSPRSRELVEKQFSREIAHFNFAF
jgi:hypothetical protein